MKNIFNHSSDKPISPLHADDKPIRNIGLIILFLTIGVFGVWSFTAPISSSAAAPGTVVVKGHRKTVQHLEGGIVAKLLAKDGDIVKEGQSLLVLDDTQAKADREMMRGQFIILSARIARLVAERDHLPHVEYPKDLDDESDARVKEAKHTESDIFISRKNTYEGEMSVLKQRIVEISSKIDGLQGQVQSKKELVSSYADEIKDLKELLAEGFADKLRLRELERNYARNNGDIAQLKSEIATSKMQQSETRLQILQIQKKFQEDVTKTLSETQAQFYEVSERLRSTDDKLKRKVITAPIAGMVQGLSVHTESGVIAPGNPILDIVPQNTELTIDAKVSPMDIDKVTVGLKAEVRFSAFKQALTPMMEGKVVHVSADSFTDEKTGIPYYKATVEVTPESLAKLNKVNFQLVPGMPADVLINTGERTFFQYLAQPVTNAFAHAFIED